MQAPVQPRTNPPEPALDWSSHRHRGVYFIEGGELLKIGFSTDILQRLSSLQAASPLELKLLSYVRGEGRQLVDQAPVVSITRGATKRERRLTAHAPRRSS